MLGPNIALNFVANFAANFWLVPVSGPEAASAANVFINPILASSPLPNLWSHCLGRCTQVTTRELRSAPQNATTNPNQTQDLGGQGGAVVPPDCHP